MSTTTTRDGVRWHLVAEWEDEASRARLRAAMFGSRARRALQEGDSFRGDIWQHEEDDYQHAQHMLERHAKELRQRDIALIEQIERWAAGASDQGVREAYWRCAGRLREEMGNGN